MNEQELAQAITAWQNVSQWLTKAKEDEMSLRQKLAKHIFANRLTNSGDLPKGTMKDEFVAGNVKFKAKVVGKENITVLDELVDATLVKLGEAGKELIKKKPELSVSRYNLLSDEQKKIADHMLSVKPGAPELTIEIITE